MVISLDYSSKIRREIERSVRINEGIRFVKLSRIKNPLQIWIYFVVFYLAINS